ncbi:MAG: hypothetical protein JW768_15830 [Chitinispirillaceae bacterium]|nr:hypothetical protein [Chitinispirillaceae bacterium]
MPRFKWLNTLLVGSLCIAPVSGAVIFSDDFSDPGTTNLNWLCPFSTITRTCANGVYTIVNSSGSAGYVHNTFTAPKPSVFTASGKVTRSSENVTAGIFVSFSTTNATGYMIQANAAQTVQVTKYPTGGNPSILLVERNAAVVGAGTNELKISKKGDSITAFCNGAFIGVVRDASPVPNGDLALLIPGSSSAIYDDIVVTDEWTGPQNISTKCFRDDFDDSQMSGWLDYGQRHQKQEDGGYFKLTTTASNAYALPYIRVDQFGLDTFAIMSSFSHRSGGITNMYGIFVCGAPIGTTVPSAYFCINASRSHDAYIDTIMVQPSAFIRGAAFEGNYYHDTIEVVKKRTGPYRMYVNGKLLDSLASSRINFSIVGVGINVDQGMVVWSDYFQYGPDRRICPVVMPLRIRPHLARRHFTPYASEYLFDPMGRIIRVGNHGQQTIGNLLVPGYYIMPDGKNGIVINKR